MAPATKSPLTKRQKQIYEFLRERSADLGHGPTIREIGTAFGIRSPNAVRNHLKALEQKGLITRTSSPQSYELRDSKSAEPSPAPRTGDEGTSYSVLASMGVGDFDALSLVDEVQRGLGYAVFEAFARESGLPHRRVAELVQISPTTLGRRKTEGRLSPQESDRLLRIARVFERAVGLFEGKRDSALRWLEAPQRALDGRVPFDFASSEVGAREVERLIHRLEHGVFP